MKDSIPTKLYEALGIGCPVLLVAEGDSCEILDESKLGRHVSPDHPEEIASIFDWIVENYDEIIRFREHSQEVIHSKYTRQQIAHEFAAKALSMIEKTV